MTPRVRRTFWVLVAVAVLAAGTLSKALGAEPGPGAALAVAASALILTASAFLVLRILIVIDRHTVRREPPERAATRACSPEGPELS